MFVSKLKVVCGVLALSLLPAGLAMAQRVRVEVPAPVFLPQADFRFDDGYYRTPEGHHYHYDHDRDGWHYGRNHREGMRYERRHRH